DLDAPPSSRGETTFRRESASRSPYIAGWTGVGPKSGIGSPCAPITTTLPFPLSDRAVDPGPPGVGRATHRSSRADCHPAPYRAASTVFTPEWRVPWRVG